jgi:hypothetical protein
VAYTYRTDDHTYRDDADAVVGQATQQDIRDGFAEASERWAENLVALLAAGRLTVDQFERELRERQARTFVAQYLLGRGGRHALTDADRQVLSDILVEQYGFARGFATDLIAGALSVDAATTRAGQYFAASTQAQARALGAAWGVTLPHHPGDLSTQCGSNCGCRISLEDNGDTVNAFWITAGIDNCDDCLRREREWNPLVLTPES